MARRSQRKLAAMRAERTETAKMRRRRELREHYPNVPVRAWAHMGKGSAPVSWSFANRPCANSVQQNVDREHRNVDTKKGWLSPTL